MDEPGHLPREDFVQVEQLTERCRGRPSFFRRGRVTFNRQAEAVTEHIAKGRHVAVTGRLEYRQWEAADGSPRSKHEVIANQVEFLAKPAGDSQPQPPVYSEGEEPF